MLRRRGSERVVLARWRRFCLSGAPAQAAPQPVALRVLVRDAGIHQDAAEVVHAGSATQVPERGSMEGSEVPSGTRKRRPLEAHAVGCVPFTLPLNTCAPRGGRGDASRHAGRRTGLPFAKRTFAPHPRRCSALTCAAAARTCITSAMAAYQPPLQQGTDSVVVPGMPQPPQQPHLRKTWRGGLFDCFGAPHPLAPPPAAPKAANTQSLHTVFPRRTPPHLPRPCAHAHALPSSGDCSASDFGSCCLVFWVPFIAFG